MRSFDKVFGIGLNKTGTKSLRRAFLEFGFAHMDRKPRLMKLWRRGDVAAIFDAIEQYESFEDWPWPLMVESLLAHYGERARFVLTRRKSAEIWVESLKGQSERTNPDMHPRRFIYGYDYPHGLEAAHIAYYERHLDDVRKLFAGCEHLLIDLCWEDGDGWDQLCPFLEQVPRRGAFPRANKGSNAQADPEFLAENRKRIAAQVAALRG